MIVFFVVSIAAACAGARAISSSWARFRSGCDQPRKPNMQIRTRPMKRFMVCQAGTGGSVSLLGSIVVNWRGNARIEFARCWVGDLPMQALGSESEIERRGLPVRPWEGLLLGLAAGVVAWGVIQMSHPVFSVGKEFDVPRIGMPPEKFAAHRREQDRVDQWHAALYLGNLGLLLGVAIGARAAVARRFWLPPIVAGSFGAIGGMVGGMVGCMVLQHVRRTIGEAALLHTMEAQLACGMPIGLGVGLGLGLATKTASNAVRYALAGLAGGALAAVVYPVVVSLLMPAVGTEALLPEGAATRLLWITVLAGTIGLVIP